MITLYVMCDVSKEAYGAVVYIVTQPANYTLFVLGKSHVIPCNGESWSIPQKEIISVSKGLCIALLSLKADGRPIEDVHMWTDSFIVLRWIRKPKIRPTCFVKKRIEKL